MTEKTYKFRVDISRENGSYLLKITSDAGYPVSFHSKSFLVGEELMGNNAGNFHFLTEEEEQSEIRRRQLPIIERLEGKIRGMLAHTGAIFDGTEKGRVYFRKVVVYYDMENPINHSHEIQRRIGNTRRVRSGNAPRNPVQTLRKGD
ncbi:hypothetical protein HYW76_05690 [Candidatus Pacearchaeota archaeon]|nr:hypothetical protein [Candidatus Pacearchaeota archaeon]